MSTELLPPQGDKDVGRKIFELTEAIISDKKDKGLHDKWLRNYKMRMAKHWNNTSGKTLPFIVANLVFTHIQRSVNMMTDNNPTFNIAQMGDVPPEQKDIFLNLQRCTEHWWIDTEQQDVLETSILHGETYGPAIEQVVFNPDLEYGVGEVETIVHDPYFFGFWPLRMSDPRDLQKCEAILTWYPKSVREIRRLYPEFDKEIKPDAELLKDLGDERREINSTTSVKQGYFTAYGSAIKEVLGWGNTAGKNDEEEVLVVSCWCKDYSKNEDGSDKYVGNIRYIETCNGGKIVLRDESNPNISDAIPPEQAEKTYLYDKFPFTMVNSVKDTSSAWGMSDIEQVEQMAKELDKTLSQFVLLKDRSARSKIINPKTSGVQNHEFTNTAGIINPINEQAAQAIRYLEAPPFNMDIERAIQLFKDLFFLIVGTFDLDQVQTGTKNVIAYKAIAALMERAATIARGKIRSYSRLIRERGRMYLSMVMNFYSEERWIPYTDTYGIQSGLKLRGTDVNVPARLTVVSGSTMPISKVQQREEALELFKANAIDAEELLEKLDWSGRAGLIKRMKEGPLSDLFSKLQAMQTPQPLIQMIQQVATMDPKVFEKALKAGQIPPFMQMLMTMLRGGEQQGNPAEEADLQIKQGELAKSMAEADKVKAETQLVAEKIATEKIEQEVRRMGMLLDEEELKMRRAETVSKISSGFKEQASKDAERRAKYNERGFKSNNKED